MAALLVKARLAARELLSMVYMRSSAATVTEFLADLPSDRKAAMTKLPLETIGAIVKEAGAKRRKAG